MPAAWPATDSATEPAVGQLTMPAAGPAANSATEPAVEPSVGLWPMHDAGSAVESVVELLPIPAEELMMDKSENFYL